MEGDTRLELMPVPFVFAAILWMNRLSPLPWIVLVLQVSNGLNRARYYAPTLGMEDRTEMKPKALIKEFIGDMPFTAEIYWLLRHRDWKINSRFNLEALAARLPEMIAQVTPYANSATPGSKIFIFASLHFWITHAVVTGLALRGLGHDVTLGYLPYGNYDKPISRFDLRRHELYARHILKDCLRS